MHRINGKTPAESAAGLSLGGPTQAQREEAHRMQRRAYSVALSERLMHTLIGAGFHEEGEEPRLMEAVQTLALEFQSHADMGYFDAPEEAE